MFPALPPHIDIDSDTDMFSNLESLKPTTTDSESITGLDFIGDAESTTNVYLENTQVFILTTDMKSNTCRFVEEATEEATANVTHDY